MNYYIYFFLIIIFTVLICYLIVKTRNTRISKIGFVRSILWLEAVAFLIIYFIADIYVFKIAWSVFMLLASIVTLMPKSKS